MVVLPIYAIPCNCSSSRFLVFYDFVTKSIQNNQNLKLSADPFAQNVGKALLNFKTDPSHTMSVCQGFLRKLIAHNFAKIKTQTYSHKKSLSKDENLNPNANAGYQQSSLTA